MDIPVRLANLHNNRNRPAGLAGYLYTMAENTQLTEGQFRVRVRASKGPLNEQQLKNMDLILDKGAEFLDLINGLQLPDNPTDQQKQSMGRLKSLAMTEIENGVMWGVKAASA